MSLLDRIEKNRLPKHVAIIMDGNGRWAKRNGQTRVFGHKNAIKSVRDVTEASAELGIPYLTLYAFSKENWNRPRIEVNALMTLLVSTIRSETETLQKNNIRLLTIGDTQSLPKKAQRELADAMELTKNNTRMSLVLALSYGAQWEVVEAARQLAIKVSNGKLNVDDINEELFAQHLTTHDIPNPELLIRTSGEYRISNFLLWQIAYSELYFTPVLWPDFRRENLYEALIDYQQRERRFGKISEQLTA